MGRFGRTGARFGRAGARFGRGPTDEEKEEERLRELFTLAESGGLKTPELKPKDEIPVLGKVFDILSRPQFAITQAIIQKSQAIKAGKGALEREKAGFKGLFEGFTGKKKTSTEDVLKEFNIGKGKLFTTPKVTTPKLPGLGKVTLGGEITGRGLVSLPADILLDPITFFTGGVGSAVKISLSTGAKVSLNKAGRTLLVNSIDDVGKRGVKKGFNLSGVETRSIAEKRIQKIIESSPDKFVDYGGIKFAGKTILPQAQQRIGRTVSDTGVPKFLKQKGAELFAPIIPGAKFKAAGLSAFWDRYLDVQRSPGLIKSRTVDDAVNFFKSETGKIPTTQQLENFFVLADQGIPLPKVTTPKLKVGEQLSESFVKAVDNAVTDPVINNLYKRYLTEIRPAFRELALGLGLKEERLLNDYIFRGVKEEVKKSATAITSPFIIKKPSPLKKRTAEAFRGETKDPIFAIAQGMTELKIAAASKKFIDDTVERFGISLKLGEDVPEGFVKYQPNGALAFFPIVTKEGKELAAVTTRVKTTYVPKEIGDLLNKMTSPKDINAFLKFYDINLRIWKGAVTSYFPAFHIRNMGGNVYNNWLGGVNDIGSYTDALRVQAGHNITIPITGKKITIPGGDLNIRGYTSKEIKQLAEDRGVIRTGAFGKDVESLLDDTWKAAEQDTAKLIRSFTGKRKVLEKGQSAVGVPRAIGTVIEDNGKLAHFISKLKQGLSPDDAAKSVRKYLFDYTDLTDFEKTVLRRIFPFYTWTRKNIPLQIESLVRTPGKPAAIGDILSALPKGEEGDVDGLPTYIKEGLFFALGEGDNGKKRFGYSISTLPLEDLNRLFRGEGLGRTAERELLGATSPLIGLALKSVSQKDFFFGQSYDDFAYTAGGQAKRSGLLTQGVRDWLEFREESFIINEGEKDEREIIRYWVNPAKWEILSSTPLTRFISTSASIDPLGQFVSPLKVRDFDIEAIKERKERKVITDFEQELFNAGLLKEFTLKFIPKDEEEKIKQRRRFTRRRF